MDPIDWNNEGHWPFEDNGQRLIDDVKTQEDLDIHWKRVVDQGMLEYDIGKKVSKAELRFGRHSLKTIELAFVLKIISSKIIKTYLLKGKKVVYLSGAYLLCDGIVRDFERTCGRKLTRKKLIKILDILSDHQFLVIKGDYRSSDWSLAPSYSLGRKNFYADKVEG